MNNNETDKTPATGEKPDIRVLSKTCEEELGGGKLGCVLVVGWDGTFQLYRPEGVKAREHKPPFPVRRINKITPSAILTYEASPGCVWIDIGGMAIEFCP